MSVAIQTSAEIEEDEIPMTARTHDGVTGHTIQPSTSNRPASPAQSAYTPTAAAASSSPASGPAPTPTSTGQTVSSSPKLAAAPTPSTAVVLAKQPEESKQQSQEQTLAKTQPLHARTTIIPSRPTSSSQASVRSRPRSSKLITHPSAQSKLPFYEQKLVEPREEVVQPLSAEHMANLPLEAALAHVSRSNAEALELMKRKEYQLAFERLKRAETFTTASVLRQDRSKAAISLRASTYNNFAILFKSINQLRQALWYANRALRLEINFVPLMGPDGVIGPRPNPAATHLNMCAILSALGRHGSALLHAECALSSLYLELHQLAAMHQQRKRAQKEAREARLARRRAQKQRQRRRRDGGDENEADADEDAEEPDDEDVDVDAELEEEDAEDEANKQANLAHETDKQSILHLIAVSYHNQAVEQEFLRQFRASTHSYRRASEFASKRLGEEHVLTKTIEHAYEGAVNLHPLKVIPKEQSMNPHVKLTVHNTGMTAGTIQANQNKWLIPSLENNPMTARHIPVRFVPFNQFVSVSGLPGRELKRPSTTGGGSRSGRASKNHGGRGSRREEAKYDDRASPNGGGADEDDEGEAPYDEHGQQQDGDAEFGPAVTQAQLRARNKAGQSRVTQQQGGGRSGSQFPNYPPPQHAMNPEESQHGLSHSSGMVGGPPEDDAGYWSDPELSDLPAATAGTNGGSRAGKNKMDPRLNLGKNGAGGNGNVRPGPSGGRNSSLPLSASLGHLDHAQQQQHSQAIMARFGQYQTQQQQQHQQPQQMVYMQPPPPAQYYPYHPQQLPQSYPPYAYGYAPYAQPPLLPMYPTYQQQQPHQQQNGVGRPHTSHYQQRTHAQQYAN